MTLDIAVFVVFFLGSLVMAVASLKLVLLLNRNPKPVGATRAEYRREIEVMPEYRTLLPWMRCAMLMIATAMIVEVVSTPNASAVEWLAVGLVCVGAVGTLVMR